MEGIVIKSTGSWYQVIDNNAVIHPCRIKGKFRTQGIKSTNPIAVGDRVEFSIEAGEETAIISEIKNRRNYIVRKSINLSKQVHIIASNIDQAFLVITISSPKTSLGFIDRFLATAEAYSINTVLIFNKIDLLDEGQKKVLDSYLKIYEQLGYTCLKTIALDGGNIETVKSLMQGKTNLISGHSGVGKSTLINKIEKKLKLKTGAISSAHLKGTHTTTFAEMFPLESGGFIIDTPGIKEFGLVHITKEELSHFFPEMRMRLNECQFHNCLHVNEPKCAIKNAVMTGLIAESRYNSYLSILSSEELFTSYKD